MPKYRYKVVGADGRKTSGVLEAGSERIVRDKLADDGYWIIHVSDMEASIFTKDLSLGGPRTSTADFTVFCRQLATMYRAGVTLVESLQILSEQTNNKSFAKVLAQMTQEMREGKQFSEVAEAFPTIFTPIFISMVQAGEIAGNLDLMLERLAVFYEKERNTKEKVKSAMVYPVVMMVLMIAVVIFMMLFVVPQYASSFEGMGIELPLATRIVMSISSFIQNFWYLVLLLLILPGFVWRFGRKNEQFRLYSDFLLLRVPVFGKLWHKQAIARFTRTFSSLISAAIPLPQGLNIVSNVVGNTAISKVINKVRDQVITGESMAPTFGESSLFPPMVVQMLEIGERSGAIDTMLDKVADFYEQDVEQMAERLKSLLEPIMILLLASVVGLIVLAIMTPTFKLMEEML